MRLLRVQFRRMADTMAVDAPIWGTGRNAEMTSGRGMQMGGIPKGDPPISFEVKEFKSPRVRESKSPGVQESGSLRFQLTQWWNVPSKSGGVGCQPGR